MFIEEIEENEGEESHPKNFEPYVPPQPETPPANSFSPFGLNHVSFSYTPGGGAQAIHIINSNMGHGGPHAHGGMVGNLMGILGNLVNGGGQDIYEGGLTFDQILQQIVANDPNKYGPPPASKKAIEKLPKGRFETFFPKNEENKDSKDKKEKEENKNCGVCYDEYDYEDKRELLQLPCKHLYHID